MPACDSGHYMAFKPVLAHASCVFDIAGFGEIGDLGSYCQLLTVESSYHR